MPTDIVMSSDACIGVANDNDALLPKVHDKEVPYVGDSALMADHEPHLAKQSMHFELEYLWIRVEPLRQ
jgi:hypothetical protein